MQPRYLVIPALALAVATACASSSGPAETSGTQGTCVTDFSCGFDQECNGAACGAITPALRPHIQTASCLLRPPLDTNEIDWRASHYDLLIGISDPDEARAVNPNIRLFEYVVARFNRFDRAGPSAPAWASAHNVNPEDLYLHYKEDVNVPTWEGKSIVPGFASGMVPGWNPGGGGNPASATSRDQSRVVGFYNGGSPWYFANVANPNYHRFLDAYIGGLIDGTWWYGHPFASGPLDGVLVDDAIWYPIFNEGLLDHSSEYYGVSIDDNHPYTVAIENLFPGLATDMMNEFASTKDIMPNYGHVLFLNYANRCAQDIQKTTPWIYGEVWVSYTGTSSPATGSNRCMSENYDYDQAVRQIIYQTRAGGRRVLGARDYSSGTAGTDRGRMLTLGLYYLISNSHTYYMYETMSGHSGSDPVSAWAYNPAVEYDIGQPDEIPPGTVDFEGHANTKEHYIIDSGNDPIYTSLTYHVYARRFTNALVLVKLLPVGAVVDDLSKTHLVLDGTYAPLNPDGQTVGAPVTEVDIRNNEALILIRL